MQSKYQITPLACLAAALMLLLLPLRWLSAAFFAACFHEGCHYVALRLCKSRPGKIAVGATGITMQIGDLSCGQELFCALAGPLGSICLIFLGKAFPRLAICGVAQGLYNLLPIYPLDGGRILHCGARLCFSPIQAQRICIGVRYLCFLGICFFGLYATFVLGLGPLPLGVGALLLMKGKKAKYPCKPGVLGVQ